MTAKNIKTKQIAIYLGITVTVLSLAGQTQGQTQTTCPASDRLVTGPGTEWWTSVASNEHSTSGRTQQFPNTCTLTQITGSPSSQGTTFSVRSAPNIYPSLYNAVTRNQNELFVYGGEAGTSAGAYVASLDPASLTELWRVSFSVAPGQWSYPGVLGAHGNGYLYAVSSNLLVKIDPATQAIVGQLSLPRLSRSTGAAYNGFIVTSEGYIVLKSMERGSCTLDGTSALSCVVRNNLPGYLVVVDPTSLLIIARVRLPQVALGRIAAENHGGIDYIYVPGVSSLFRYRFASGVLSADTTWGDIGYDGGANGGGVGILGDWAVMQTNFLTSQTPCRLVVANVNTGQSFTATPFKTRSNRMSYSFSKAALDDVNGRIYAQDTGTGVVVAAHIASTGIVSDWKVANVSKGFIFLQGPDNNRQIIMPNSTSAGDQLIWRNPVSGAALAKTPVLTSTPTLSPITPGFAGRVYYPEIQTGKLIEVVPTRSTPESSDRFLGLRPI